MLSTDRLRELLEGIGLRDAQIHVEGAPGHLVANLVSPEFENQDDAERQARVWEHLYSRISDAERTEIDFIFTVTPDEDAAL